MSIPRPSSRRRLRLRRRPLPWWTGALVLAGVTALLVGRLAGDAAAERDRWGETVVVAVATADVAPGEVVVAERRRLPRSVVPAGAAGSADGAVAAVALHAGEIVLEARLAPGGTSAVAALVPEGHRAVAVPSGDGLPLAVGDAVDVLATLDPESAQPTFAVSRAARVVHVGESSVTVAVPLDDAPRVAFALAVGAVTLALSGWR
jgi:Flp pilus assembly protein CpaB